MLVVVLVGVVVGVVVVAVVAVDVVVVVGVVTLKTIPICVCSTFICPYPSNARCGRSRPVVTG